jgi:tetratricopeptide (TPR) repeat protein
MSAPAAAPAERAGGNDHCPCGSGRKFKQCCGVAHPRAASASSPRSARPDRLKFGPLSEAGKLRDAAEQPRHSMHGVPSPLPNAGNAGGAGRAIPARRQTEAAERFRRQGAGQLRARKLPAAITALRQATRLDPADAGSHRALGLALLRSGRLAEATASFELAPVMADGHRRLADLLEAEGDAEDAAISYRRAAAADPETTKGRLNKINAVLLDGDPRQAEALLRQAIALDPASNRLHKVLGDVLTVNGHFDEAIAAFDRALDLCPLQVGATTPRPRRSGAPRRTAPGSTGCGRCSTTPASAMPTGIPPFRHRQGARRSGGIPRRCGISIRPTRSGAGPRGLTGRTSPSTSIGSWPLHAGFLRRQQSLWRGRPDAALDPWHAALGNDIGRAEFSPMGAPSFDQAARRSARSPQSIADIRSSWTSSRRSMAPSRISIALKRLSIAAKRPSNALKRSCRSRTSAVKVRTRAPRSARSRSSVKLARTGIFTQTHCTL